MKKSKTKNKLKKPKTVIKLDLDDELEKNDEDLLDNEVVEQIDEVEKEEEQKNKDQDNPHHEEGDNEDFIENIYIQDNAQLEVEDNVVEGVEISIRGNLPPRKSWIDRKIPSFKLGEYVAPIYLKRNKQKDFEAWKIVGYGTFDETYIVSMSRILKTVELKAIQLRKAPKKCKPYISFWDANDPLKQKIKGVKISCPSNEKKRK